MPEQKSHFLLPCPFCGKPPRSSVRGTHWGQWVSDIRCSTDRCPISLFQGSFCDTLEEAEKDAADRWNVRRPSLGWKALQDYLLNHPEVAEGILVEMADEYWSLLS